MKKSKNTTTGNTTGSEQEKAIAHISLIINEFFSFGRIGDHIDFQNELLTTFIDEGLTHGFIEANDAVSAVIRNGETVLLLSNLHDWLCKYSNIIPPPEKEKRKKSTFKAGNAAFIADNSKFTMKSAV